VERGCRGVLGALSAAVVGLNLLGQENIYIGETLKNMAGTNTRTFTDAGWDKDVLNSDVPVLVDFWAEWCGPCRMMSPTVDAIANDYAGRVKVGKLNVDENGSTSMRYQVRGIPTLLLFKGGKVVEQKVGAVGKSDVQKMLDAHVITAVKTENSPIARTGS
jgi:thioredoxin 1